MLSAFNGVCMYAVYTERKIISRKMPTQQFCLVSHSSQMHCARVSIGNAYAFGACVCVGLEIGVFLFVIFAHKRDCVAAMCYLCGCNKLVWFSDHSLLLLLLLCGSVQCWWHTLRQPNWMGEPLYVVFALKLEECDELMKNNRIDYRRSQRKMENRTNERRQKTIIGIIQTTRIQHTPSSFALFSLIIASQVRKSQFGK